MQQIRRPRTDDPRELEKWQDDVSRQINDSKSTSENEVLFWLLNEGKNPENKEQLLDIEAMRIEMAMMSMSPQEIRDVLSKVNEVETKLEVTGYIHTHDDQYQGKQILVFNYNTDHVLNTTDFYQIHIMDVTGGNRTFTLPDINTGQTGKWIILARKGVINKLILQPSGSGIIFNSGVGGHLECSDANHDYSSINLVVLANDIWGNGSFGIWSTV